MGWGVLFYPHGKKLVSENSKLVKMVEEVEAFIRNQINHNTRTAESLGSLQNLINDADTAF